MKTKQYTITADNETLLMFERLMSWLHWNGRWGHSGTVGMPFDGDGNSGFTVDSDIAAAHREYVQSMNPGKDVEIIYSDDYIQV